MDTTNICGLLLHVSSTGLQYWRHFFTVPIQAPASSRFKMSHDYICNNTAETARQFLFLHTSCWTCWHPQGWHEIVVSPPEWMKSGFKVLNDLVLFCGDWWAQMVMQRTVSCSQESHLPVWSSVFCGNLRFPLVPLNLFWLSVCMLVVTIQ